MCAVPARGEAEFLVESAGYRGKAALAVLSGAEMRKHPLRRLNAKRQELMIDFGEGMLAKFPCRRPGEWIVRQLDRIGWRVW